MLWDKEFGTHAPSIVLAAYGLPGVIAIAILLGMGFRPERIGVLTYERDRINAPLLDVADSAGLDVVVTSVDEPETIDWLRAREPSALFSLHYRDRIPAVALAAAKHGCINLHPSLLPDYKGCFSIPWAIINGERYTGFTWHYMAERFDTGPILVQERLEILPGDTAYSLYHRQIVHGMAKFENVIRRVLIDRDPGRPQPSRGRYYSRSLPHHGRIDRAWPQEQIERFIRAMYFPPHRGAILMIDNREIEVRNIEDYREMISPSPRR